MSLVQDRGAVQLTRGRSSAANVTLHTNTMPQVVAARLKVAGKKKKKNLIGLLECDKQKVPAISSGWTVSFWQPLEIHQIQK